MTPKAPRSELDTAALPARLEHLRDRRFQAFVRVGNHQFHALEPSLFQGTQKIEPEHRRFRRAEAQTQNLALAFGINGRSDYGSDRNDAAVLAHFQIGGVEPQIGPIALDPPIEEGVHPLVDVLAKLGHLAFRNARHAHRLHQVIDFARRNALNPGLLHHGDERPLGGLARLQEGGKIAALTQLRDFEIERAQTRFQIAFAKAITLRRARLVALVARGADEIFDVVVHQLLQNRFGEILQKVAAAALAHHIEKCHCIVGHRVVLR